MYNIKYPKFLLYFIIFWLAIYFFITLSINPYGISPVNFVFNKFNKYKVVRKNIDRFIKPYEVWRYQPKTIFLGTSRIHQSIDPSILNDSYFSPAYNASIPASTLSLNASHLKQYINLDPNLKTVFVELFLYNFLGQEQEHVNKNFSEFLINTYRLFFSIDTLWGSINTFGYNFIINKPAYEIKPGGFFYYPDGHIAKGPFDGFPEGIWKIHNKDGYKLHQPAFEAIDEIIQLCNDNNIELIFILSPNHAYFDYYFDDIKLWNLVDEWLSRLTAKKIKIYSFSQPNDFVYETVSIDMKYWYDPSHFTTLMGHGILDSLLGKNIDDLPANFVLKMTQDNYQKTVVERQKNIKIWGEQNPDFVQKFKSEKFRYYNPNLFISKNPV